MRAVAGDRPEILAASVKSPEQAVATLIAGAQHLTLPLAVIESMGDHELSQAAIEEFGRAGRA
jgi:transaldolase